MEVTMSAGFGISEQAWKSNSLTYFPLLEYLPITSRWLFQIVGVSNINLYNRLTLAEVGFFPFNENIK